MVLFINFWIKLLVYLLMPIVCLLVILSVCLFVRMINQTAETTNHQTCHRDSPSWVLVTHLGHRVTKCNRLSGWHELCTLLSAQPLVSMIFCTVIYVQEVVIPTAASRRGVGYSIGWFHMSVCMCVCVCAYVCNNFAWSYLLNEQALGNAIQQCWGRSAPMVTMT